MKFLVLYFSLTAGFVQKYSYQFVDKFYNVYSCQEPTNDCLFYSGGNSNMPHEIYNSFLSELASRSNRVCIVDPEFRDHYFHLKEMTHNRPTTMIAHSSGANEALKALHYLDNVNKLVLIDPVDSRLNNNGKEYNIPSYVKEVLIIYASKSYQWSFYPFKIPFIPAFGIKQEKIISENKTILNMEEYGHCDILDYNWGKIMHETLSTGISERNPLKIQNYHKELSNIISP